MQDETAFVFDQHDLLCGKGRNCRTEDRLPAVTAVSHSRQRT